MTYLLDVADDNVDEAMEEDPPPSQNVVNPPPHDVSTIAQRESLPQLVNLSNHAVSTATVAEIDPPFYGPSNQGSTDNNNEVTTTTTSDVYQLVNLSYHAVSIATVAQGTSDTNQATIDQPFYGPYTNQGTTDNNNEVTTTAASDVYPPPLDLDVLTVAAKGTYYKNEVTTTTTSTTMNTSDTNLFTQLNQFEITFERDFNNFMKDDLLTTKPNTQIATSVTEMVPKEAPAPMDLVPFVVSEALDSPSSSPFHFRSDDINNKNNVSRKITEARKNRLTLNRETTSKEMRAGKVKEKRDHS